mmetsp:Transcript_79582/g.125524  ORF Transcript_79582/g.125524 Transcript_79582/m.125524 type:complete len:261 (-) Transcript_79582:1368-2150(-)
MNVMSCCLQTCRSSGVKPYGMFHPIGPNFRRSCTTAWKKQKPNRSVLKISGLFDSSQALSVMELYDRSKLARSPAGGSFVILTPFCNTCTGKLFAGIDVSHRRKLFDMDSGLSCSTMASRSPIHDSIKWQFERSTQPPMCWAFSIILVAFGPCPWPKEIDSKRRFIPRSSAKTITSATGSVPGDRINTNGVVFTESAKDFAISKVGGSTNFCPICSAMNDVIAFFKLSILKARIQHSFCSEVSLPSQSPGIFSLSASTAS